MESPDYTFDESDIVGIPMPPPKKSRAKKPDNRSVSSKANIVKALQAKKRQKEEEFEIEEVSDSESESESSDEEVIRKANTKAKAKKQIKEKQQNLYTEQQMGELRHIVKELAKAQKKSNRQKKKTIIQMPRSEPVAIPQPQGKKEPDMKTEQLKQSILRF